MKTILALACLFVGNMATATPRLHFSSQLPEPTVQRLQHVIPLATDSLTNCTFFRIGFPTQYEAFLELATSVPIKVTSFADLKESSLRKHKKNQICSAAPVPGTIIYYNLDYFGDPWCPVLANTAHELLHLAGFVHSPGMAGVLDTCLYPGAGDTAVAHDSQEKFHRE